MRTREEVLAAVRAGLKVSAADSARKALVQQRLATKPHSTKPSFANLEGQEKLQRFKRKAQEKGVQLHSTSNEIPAPRIIASIADGKAVSATRAVIDLGLKFKFAKWQAKSSSSCCVSTCECAIAETGTLVLTSEAKTPISQVFLAEIHIVLLNIRDIEEGLEAVWARLQNTEHSSVLPRDITLVSGPSSTGDIELQMEKGAHGPRELHVVLYDDLVS